MKRSFHKRSLIKLFTQAHWSHSQSHTIMDFSNLWKHCYRLSHPFSHSIKLCGLPLSTVTVSLRFLPRWLRLTVTCGTTPAIITVTWSEQ